MSNIDKQALRSQSIEGSFYLVECCNCGEMYPSNLLDGGEAIADSGDYGDCYCHLCGADGTERADWGDVNSNEAKAWNFQQKRIESLLDELEAAEKRIAELSGEFFALPPLNDDLIAILGRPNFTCAHLAELLRKGGQDIRRKAEHEQAAVIYWFLDLYLKYGEKWESIAKDDIQSRVAMITAGTAKGE
ncbi:TPA: ead/Ea22-like family protein [Enterobacter asburiae]|nr:ead/Ea22-like family protein [Enterobacter asburiae]